MSNQVHELPMSKIWSDELFNCRGRIYPVEVRTLAKSIETDGLFQPIVVRKIENKDFDYKIIIGHRRYAAFQYLNKDTIPAIIRKDIKDDDAARALNILENLQRQDLDMLQEAKAIKIWIDHGWTSYKIAKTLNVTERWVETRRRLLELPREVQEVAAAGYLNNKHILALYKERHDYDKLMEMIRTVQELREAGEKTIEITGRKNNRNRKTVLNKQEILAITRHIREVEGPGSIAGDMGALCAGVMTEMEFLEHFKEYLDILEIEYVVPPAGVIARATAPKKLIPQD